MFKLLISNGYHLSEGFHYDFLIFTWNILIGFFSLKYHPIKFLLKIFIAIFKNLLTASKKLCKVIKKSSNILKKTSHDQISKNSLNQKCFQILHIFKRNVFPRILHIFLTILTTISFNF